MNSYPTQTTYKIVMIAVFTTLICVLFFIWLSSAIKNTYSTINSEEINLSKILIDLESKKINKQGVLKTLGNPDKFSHDNQCFYYKYDFLSRPIKSYDFPHIRICFTANDELESVFAPFKIRGK